MDIGTLGFFVTTIGELLVGYSILRVHSSLAREHKIDKKVVREVNKEKVYTIAGMLLIIVGFFLQIM
ncbi:hypothetical protein C4564_05690 [Candidatus Microgenomates bacterium]|nr:MAG: hypothetical protein C4564_05690 [Candidatus Microgenomates bacterium]